MSKYKIRTAQDGKLIIDFQNCTPLIFDTVEDVSAWEHAFLTCTMKGNSKTTCFTTNPPQRLVDEGKGHRRTCS